MSDDIQKEAERIHHGIVESLSFSEALAKRDALIQRLRALLREALPYFGLQTVADGLQVPHPLGVRIREALGDD